MPSIFSSAPFPAAMLAIGCMTGMMGSRYAPDDAVRLAPAPKAAMANLPVLERAVDDLAADAQAEAESRADNGTGGAQVVRSGDGLFYVGAQVNGHHVRFLVDTGASVTILRAADARALGVMPDAGRYGQRVQTVGGSAAMAWTHLASMRVGGREIHDVRVAVVRQGLGVSLLGQNTLQRLGSLKIEGDKLELR